MRTINEAAVVGIIALLFVSTAFTAVAYFFIKSRLLKATERREKKSELRIEDAIKKEIDKSLAHPSEVQSDGVLPESSALIGLVKLEANAQAVRPDIIVGINRGGWLLSAYLAHRLEIERSSILRYDSAKNKIVDANSTIKGFSHMAILLVDDISRSGRSMEKGLKDVQALFPNSQIKTSVLVTCNAERTGTIDFAAYYTKEPDIQLPWSSDKRKKEARQRLAEKGKKALLVGQSSDEDTGILRLAYEDDKSLTNAGGIDIASQDISVLKLYEAARASGSSQSQKKVA